MLRLLPFFRGIYDQVGPCPQHLRDVSHPAAVEAPFCEALFDARFVGLVPVGG